MLVKNVFIPVTITVSSYLYLLSISCMVEHCHSVMSPATYKYRINGYKDLLC